jgi:hypothetical protein
MGADMGMAGDYSVTCDGCGERVLAVEIIVRHVVRSTSAGPVEVRLCLLCADEVDRRRMPGGPN